jgi:hypothetical protein
MLIIFGKNLVKLNIIEIFKNNISFKHWGGRSNMQ